MECAFLGFCACPGLWFIEECVVLRLCWYIDYRTRNVWLCACVGLWSIERGILHLECAFLAERTVRIERTVYIALCPDVIMKCTLRMSTDRTNRNALCAGARSVCLRTVQMERNRNASCPHVIMRSTLCMCSAYRPWVIVTVCAERTVRQLLFNGP